MTDTTDTYLAVQAVSPGKLELTRKPMQAPGPGHVRIKIEACGVCHSDAATVEGVFPISWPRVPGHEVVGKIESLGAGVEGWNVGQRVGVGFLAGSCGHCSECRSGHLVNCKNQEFTGVHHDGGYAEWMVAKASGLMSIPDDLTDVEAAPLLCAGLTTFSALRNSGAKAGDVVAIIGIGGLGHLAVQYARGMGFEVVAIGRGPAVGELAIKLGAHHYIDSTVEPVADALQRLGGADLVLATASGGKGVADSVNGLKARGKTIVIGATAEPIELGAGDLFLKERSVEGALTGDPATGDTTLRFSSLFGISAMIEEIPLEQAVEAYNKMMHGKPRFRIVLTMGK
ncbi:MULTISPECIES: alcohol dehydrogenase catalytic domain-containing protein [unclassified Rhizobium]|uniref:alcohol dehydrogenase catalytic domain-containing protein n=1 Tax=unclassified Rhizobium TaxID=2613769 RepID=UPI001ADA1B12|nr:MULTISPECIES: alcohol dehydrogenase catalytic domain-containing protein [unclassified Rhizobium]MBO9127969.1 alcohol dehydrogenase catalytic domain-containing protein [Rhizobium sp. 16-488-2b]MBO9178546.1 alcohol dehydrogenase catalytic domain-containing protein [Rhizobium sp. 16-488-2a]